MEKSTIIYEQKTKTTKIRILKSLSISFVTAIIIFLITHHLIRTGVIAIGSFIFQLFRETTKYFDGIKITKNSIQIQRQNFTKEIETHDFEFSQIDKVFFSESKARKPRYAIIYLKESGIHYHIYITSSIFKFAYALRQMKNKGVTTELEFGDHEVELFLNGRIPDLPMTNDMPVTNMKNS